MPTYGDKWRASSNNSSACDKEHVSRSSRLPFLRLDSTGEVSSVDHTTRVTPPKLTNSAPEVNGNSVNMKNLFVNRFWGVTGTNLTGSGKKTTVDTDLNANLMDRITNIMPGCVTANAMDSRNQNQKFVQPQCSFSGWNYTGQSMPRFGSGSFPLFPCHQFANSFSFGHCGQSRSMDSVYHQEFHHPSQFGQKPSFLNSHVRHVPKKYDRSYRGHSPKHHKPEQKNMKHHMSSEKIPSKCVKMVDSDTGDVQCVSANLNAENNYSSENKSKDMSQEVTPVDTKCSFLENNKIEKTETEKQTMKEPTMNCAKSDSKKMFICDITEESKNKFNINITESCKKQAKMEDSESENSSSEGMDSHKQESNIQVLFIRKDKKKGRPSSGKKRRRKLQKAKSSSTCPEDCNEENRNMDKDTVHHSPNPQDNKGRCSATVSFILGLSQSPSSPGLQGSNSSFVFSISDDETGGESDDNWESDDFDVETEFGQCDLFNFLPCNNNFLPNNTMSTPINLQLHISPVQKSGTQSKTLEDINSRWNVNISLNDKGGKPKRNQSKKVHFPEDKNLSVIHPMITWSYAYQAARKGHWENFVRDRDRFQRRIREVEDILVPVLSKEHRNYVYAGRFDNEN